MTASNRLTSYETGRNVQSPDAGKRSNRDISSWHRNSKGDQEMRSGELDASAENG